MRKLVFDSETTGIDYREHRMISLGFVELFDEIPTGQKWEFFFKVPIEITEESVRITGITNEMLADKLAFQDHVDEILDIIACDPLIAHNANFDVSFLNKELSLVKKDPIKNHVIDTLQLARKLFPNTSNSLDALCKRFKINNTHRKLHGALLDAELLAMVYYKLIFQQIDINHEKQQTNDEVFIKFPERKWEVDASEHEELIKKYAFKS